MRASAAAAIALYGLTLFAQEPPVLLRDLRIYGGTDETAPPILQLPSEEAPLEAPGYPFVTLELDVESPLPPALLARLVHCRPDWQESQNVFLAFGLAGTTLFSWESAPAPSSFYTYRGRLRLPNAQLSVPYAGNWKVLLYDARAPTTPLAEARFFAVKPAAECRVTVYADLYTASPGVSPAAVTVEAWVRPLSARRTDRRLHTVVFYRNHRWCEPYVVTQDARIADTRQLYSTGYRSSISGMLPAGKLFRVEQLPAQNEYRVLDLSNPAQFPPGAAQPIRLPMADLRRRGNFWEFADDGALRSAHLPPHLQDYIPVEFILDPEGAPPSAQELFLVGSFNHWCPSAQWQLAWDEQEGVYRLRQLLRRGRHNYLYATGRLNADTRQVEALDFAEWEGNTTAARHTFFAFVYYLEPDFGGYDALIAVGAASIYGPLRR
jgi:hypothetical protein